MLLSVTQIHRIESSFELIEPRLEELVSVFYARFFEMAPAARELFQDEMGLHKKHLANAIRLVAQNITSIENLADPLRQMGARHAGYGAQEDQYPIVRDSMLFAMAEIAGYTWTTQLNDDWRVVLNEIIELMIEGKGQAQQRVA